MNVPPDVLRTPDECFDNLPGYDFSPHYVDTLVGYEGLRTHYVDEGPRDAGDVMLCLHGEPTWAYLYRKMIPIFVEAGCRVVAPDFLGFGRSDKPTDDARYTFTFHRDFLLRFIDHLDLDAVTLVCQDWGGLLGLTLPLDKPNLIRRLLVMNTGIGTGKSPGPGFDEWKAFVASQDDLDVARLMRRAVPGLSDDEAGAYGAPFPDARYKAGVRRFPEIVPVTPEMDGVEIGRRSVKWWSETWSGQTFMAVGVKDPVLGAPVMNALRERIRGCGEPLMLEDAGHFVQEHGDVIARAALEAWS